MQAERVGMEKHSKDQGHTVLLQGFHLFLSCFTTLCKLSITERDANFFISTELIFLPPQGKTQISLLLHMYFQYSLSIKVSFSPFF